MIIKELIPENTINTLSDVIKKLVKNSIDARSEEISIEISGIDFIKVVDNGESIKKEEIYNLSNDRIRTLFLISNVSKVRIKSSSNGVLGYEFVLENGRLVDFRNTYFNKGTAVIIQDLFYNLPNRKSFLINSVSELQKTKDIILNYSLLFQNIEFKLEINGKAYKFEKAVSKEERIRKIFGDFERKVLKTSRFNLEIYAFDKKIENKIFFNSDLVKDDRISEMLSKFQINNYLLFISTQYPTLREANVYKDLQKFLSSNIYTKIIPKVIYSVEKFKSNENKFLITVSGRKILIIHKDRALHRIYLQKLKRKQFVAKSLPVPYTFKLKIDDEIIEVMKLYSINVIKGKGVITITTVPDIIENINYEDMGKILEKIKNRKRLFEISEFLKEIANMAVKYSHLKDEEIVPMLLSFRNPEFDENHTRVIYEIDLDEIGNKF